MDALQSQPIYYLSFEEDVDNSLPTIFPVTASHGIDALTATVSCGPNHNRGGRRSHCGWSGSHALLLRGSHTTDGEASARIALVSGLCLPVQDKLRLSYVVFPDFPQPEDTDLSYTSHFVALDLTFSDGTTLSSLALPDQNGHTVTARDQGESRSLFSREWNFIEVDLTPAAGKIITGIEAVYDKPEGKGELFTYLDDIKLAVREDLPVLTPADDVQITRGTMNTEYKSRGLMFPAVCVPNAFNFWAPASYTDRFFYDYQESSLVDFRISHQSSYHLLDHGVFQFMPNVTATAAEDAQLCESARRSHFSHDTEIAHAHEYAVTFDDDSPAGCSRVEIAPTDHAAVIRITFPPFSERRNIIFDCHNTSGLINAKGSLTFSGCTFRAVIDYHFPQLNAADGNVDHVVAAKVKFTLADLDQGVLQKLGCALDIHRAGSLFLLVEGIQILVKTPQRHGIASLIQKAGMNHPDQLQRLGKALRRTDGQLMAVVADGGKACVVVALAAHQRLRLLGVGSQTIAQRGQGDLHAVQKLHTLHLGRMHAARVGNGIKHSENTQAQRCFIVGRVVVGVGAEMALREGGHRLVGCVQRLVGDVCK